jgi:hypothetical protein
MLYIIYIHLQDPYTAKARIASIHVVGDADETQCLNWKRSRSRCQER